MNSNAIISSILKKNAAFVIALLGTLHPVLPAEAAMTSFTPGETIYRTDLSVFSGGKSAQDLGWGGAAPQNFIGAAPRGTGYGGSIVIEGISTASSGNTLNAPQVTLPSFAAGDKIFFSAPMFATNSNESGARILLRTDNVAFVGGFGLLDLASKTFLINTAEGYKYSTETYTNNHWYELAFIIELHQTDITLSTGSLFVRDLTLGESDFRAVEGLNGILMGYTAEQNLNNFSYFRFERFRTNAQIGDITVGYALEAIPEPGTTALSITALVLGSGLLLWRKPASRLR